MVKKRIDLNKREAREDLTVGSGVFVLFFDIIFVVTCR